MINKKPVLLSQIMAHIEHNFIHLSNNLYSEFIRLNLELLRAMCNIKPVFRELQNKIHSQVFQSKLKKLDLELYEKLIKKVSKKKEVKETKEVRQPSPAKHKQEQQKVQRVPTRDFDHDAPPKPKPQQKAESPLEDSQRLIFLIEKANLQTKKEILKSILQHLNVLHNQDNTRIFQNCIDILNCVSKCEDIDKEILSLCFIVIEILNQFSEDADQQQELIDSSLNFFQNQTLQRDQVAEQFIKNPVRALVLQFFIGKLDEGENVNEILTILKLLMVFLKISRGSKYHGEFHSEIMENKEELKQVMKKLYGHSEVSVRKNVVLFFVQGYYFFKTEAFTDLISQFSIEQ